MRREDIMQALFAICREAEDLFAAGIEDLKIMRGDDGKPTIALTDENHRVLFGGADPDATAGQG